MMQRSDADNDVQAPGANGLSGRRADERAPQSHADNPHEGDGNGRSPHAAPAVDADLSPVNTTSASGFWPVLKNQNFLALWGGQVFSQLADKVYLVLMILIITHQFQQSGQTVSGWVSAIMVAFTIPAVLFGSVAGVFVDYWPKKGVLVATNLLRGGLVLSLPLGLALVHRLGAIAHLPPGFVLLLAITFLVSTLTQFFAPAEQATIPLLVERRHLLPANSLYTTTMMASVIIGFAVGEPLLAWADEAIAPLAGFPDIGKELLVGGCYALAGLLLLLIQPHEPRDRPHHTQPPIWREIREGLAYLQQNHRVRAALIQLVVLFSIFAALAVLAVRLAEVMPALESSQFGFLLAAGGVGMAIGALVVGYLGHRMSRAQLSLVGSMGLALSLGLVALFQTVLVPTLVILVGLGISAAVIGVPLQTQIQEETPEAMRGKVFGLQNNAVNIALSLPLALAGIAETFLGLRLVFLGLAAIALLSGLLTWGLAQKGSTTSASKMIKS